MSLQTILKNYFIDHTGPLDVSAWLEAAGQEYGFARLSDEDELERLCGSVIGSLANVDKKGRSKFMKTLTKNFTAARQVIERQKAVASAAFQALDVGLQNRSIATETLLGPGRKRKTPQADDLRTPPKRRQPGPGRVSEDFLSGQSCSMPDGVPNESQPGQSGDMPDGEPVLTPCRTHLQRTFASIKNVLASPADMYHEQVNVSQCFRKFQHKAYVNAMAGDGKLVPTAENKHEILALHHVLLISPDDLPPFISQASRKPRKVDVRKSWWARLCTTRDAANETTTMRGTLAVPDSLMRAAAQNVSAVDKAFHMEMQKLDAEDKLFEVKMRWTIVCRAFALGILQQKRRASHQENEDTSVHVWLHAPLQEIFMSSDTVIMWANGQSVSSKSHRESWAAGGKKPDFSVVRGEHELIFGEFKPQTSSTGSQAAVSDFVKLAVFLQGSLNANVKGKHPYGIQMTKNRLEVYVMTLKHSGLYVLEQVASVALPRKVEDFANLPALFETLWSIRPRINGDSSAESEPEITVLEAMESDSESCAESEESNDSILPKNYKREGVPTP
ncbi:hypothetical protein HKX48_007590, partial [Thoreauomyces humboldtii]